MSHTDRLGIYLKIEWALNKMDKWCESSNNEDLIKVRLFLAECFTELNNQETKIIELQAEASALERKLAQYKNNLLKFTQDEVN